MCNLEVGFWSWFDMQIKLKGLKLVYLESFEMIGIKPIGICVFMLDGWEVSSYMMIPSLRKYQWRNAIRGR